MANKTFTIKCTMEERWMPYFLTMLGHMNSLGMRGESKYIGIFSDGDGDFRPKFFLLDNLPSEMASPKKSITIRKGYFYDAG